MFDADCIRGTFLVQLLTYPLISLFLASNLMHHVCLSGPNLIRTLEIVSSKYNHLTSTSVQENGLVDAF